MPVYHSGNLRDTDRPNYNYPLRPQTKDLTIPLAPRNVFVTTSYLPDTVDIRWDDPKIIVQNKSLEILGCNVYRSINNPYGPYEKINSSLVNILFYRDRSEEVYVENEDVTPTLRYNLEPEKRWYVYTQYPFIIPKSKGTFSNRVQDVKVEIDNGDGQFLEVSAYKVNGAIKQIELINYPIYNYQVNQIIPPRLPYPPNGRVRVSYYYLKHSVISSLSQRIFYKVTTVAVDPKDPNKTIETPLDEISARSLFDIEPVDYIWREAIRRNRWILEQGGERVKLFIRKSMGTRCEDYKQNYGQAYNDCLKCFGTGFVGGYDGPFDIIIAPPETERQIELTEIGLRMVYEWVTWTTDYPLINMRDLIVRQNNERYVVSAVNPVGSRGAIYQQHFNLSYIDQRDIRYCIPITGAETNTPPSYDAYREQQPTDASPVINKKPEIPQDKIIKGRTVTYENIMY